MSVYILSALLLIILGYAVFQLTKKSELDAEIEQLTQQDESYLLAELYSVNATVWLCFAGGLLLTANYAITYFSGSDVRFILDWGFTQWSGAFIGLVVTVAITSVQKVLYASPTHHKAGLLVTTLILIFVIFSEIGSPIEKEEMKVAEKSENSAVFKAVVGKIGSSVGGSSPSAYSGALAKAKAGKAEHVFELGRCGRHKAKGAKRVQRCETFENREIAKFQAQIDSFNGEIKNETTINANAQLALVDKAKELEKNTDNHSGLIKFVKTALDVDFLEAMMLASLILVVAFEAGFHFAGSRAGVLKAALIKMGNKDITYATERKRAKKAEKYRQYLSPASPNKQASTYQPATAFSSNLNTGTHEQQFDMFGMGKPSVEKQKPLKNNLTPTSPDLTGKGGKVPSEEGVRSKSLIPDKNTRDLEDDAYVLLKTAVLGGHIKPTIPQGKKHLDKQTPKIGSNGQKRQDLVESAYQKMHEKGYIKLNPLWTDSTCGRAKYLTV